jgi:hypothetical protein
LSNPRRCRFLAKNSETEMSRCRDAISSAVEPRVDLGLVVRDTVESGRAVTEVMASL